MPPLTAEERIANMHKACIDAKAQWRSPEVEDLIARSITGDVRLALISVFHKQGIEEFAKALVELGWKIISTGGTRRALEASGIPVTDVAELSGLAPVLDHRVATLVPEVAGGLQATPEMREELQGLRYPWIDLACVDLYPLEDEVERDGATLDSVQKVTDIGGPTMIREAVKGRRIVIADPLDRQRVVQWLQSGEPDGEAFRRKLGAKAEGVIAQYVLTSARFLSKGEIDGVIGTQKTELKYGENAWQKPAGLFANSRDDDPLGIDKFQLVEGDAPSFNNLCDAERMLQTMTHMAAGFERNMKAVPLMAVGVKHGNSCGSAIVGATPEEVLENMLSGDLIAIHGGLIMTNFLIDGAAAEVLRKFQMEGDEKRLLDGVLAPSFDAAAKVELNRKTGKCRLLQNPVLGDLHESSLHASNRLRQVRGGFLRQPNYTYVLDLADPELEGPEALPLAEDIKRDMILAWAIGSTSNSNTITIVKDGQLLGNGVGQQDRVGAANLGCYRAARGRHDIRKAVAYSDSFFPYPDGPMLLAVAGVETILATRSPTGTKRDAKIREICRAAGVALYTLPDAKARGFYGH